MTSRRVQKAAEAIREVVSMAILTDLRDPRIQNVTVTYVDVSPDLRQATVHVSVMGDEKQQDLTLHGLASAAGYLQQKVARRIDTRYTPRLRFELDMGVKRALEIERILESVLPASAREGKLGEGKLGDGELGDGELGDGELGDGNLGDGVSGDGELDEERPLEAAPPEAGPPESADRPPPEPSP